MKKKSFDADVKLVARKYFTALNTPISLGAWLRVKYECWDDLAAMRVDPAQYLDAVSVIDKFRRDYAAVNLLRKYDGLPLSRDLEAEAVDAFYRTEAQCKLSNVRLSAFECPVGMPNALLEFLHRLRKNVDRVLGGLPASLKGRFGPGTTFELEKQTSDGWRVVAGKLATSRFCTPAAAAVVAHATDSTWWSRSLLREAPYKSSLRFVEGNRFTTVPKNATTKRGICVEPGANVFAQLAVGEEIRNRLRYIAGIDILNAQNLHTMMAMEGSRSGVYATIDLSSASDTICRKMIKLALGYSPWWCLLLDCLRSPKTRVKGRWVWLEKFSSMGNGFTFELETLLFLCIALAATGRQVGDPEVKVYGDDIIVPAQDAEAVVSALKMCGFTPNPKKTFLSGPFRESCGGDYFMGERVTPFYLKNEPKQPSDWITIANGLYAERYGFPAAMQARSKVGLALRVFGPKELGDTVIHERNPRRWTSVWRHGIRWIRGYVPVHRKVSLDRYSPDVQLAAALYGAPSDGLIPRDAVSGYRYRWLAFS